VHHEGSVDRNFFLPIYQHLVLRIYTTAVPQQHAENGICVGLLSNVRFQWNSVFENVGDETTGH